MFVEPLYHFQEMEMKESEIEQAMKRLPQFKQLKVLKERFTAHQNKLEEKKLARQDIARRLKKCEGQVAAWEVKEQEMSKLLYAGEINNPKELESLESQVDAMKKQISEASPEILRLMEEKEDVDRELGQMEQELQERYGEFNKLKFEYQRVKINLEQQLAALRQDKEQVSSRVEKRWMDWYRGRKEQFGGKPLAKVMENGACSGCRTVIPVIIIKEARANPGTVFCENCGRMLCIPDIY